MSGRDARVEPRSRSGPAVVAAIALLDGLDFLFRPVLASSPAGPDLVVGAVLIGALRLRAGWAAVSGFVLGLLDAAMVLSGLGWLSVLYAVAAYGGARGWALFFTDERYFLPAYLLVGSIVLIFVSEWIIFGDLNLHFILVAAPLSAIGTALISLVVDRLVAWRR